MKSSSIFLLLLIFLIGCDQINNKDIQDTKNYILIKVDSFQNTVAHKIFVNKLDTTRHLIVTYMSDGTVLGESYFKKGLRDGIYKVFYGNGKLMVTERYLNGLKNGEQIEYYPNGKYRKKDEYTYGKLISTKSFDSSANRNK